MEDLFKKFAAYLARIHAILKHTKINIPLLNTPSGQKLRKKIEEVSEYLFLLTDFVIVLMVLKVDTHSVFCPFCFKLDSFKF